MRFVSIILPALLIVVVAAPLTAVAAGPPEYGAVHAVFAKHCMGCHDAKEAEGEFVMERFELLMKGGESGAAIVAGKAGESPLVAMIEHNTKPFMPPPKKGAKLSDAEIALVRAWIDAGAKPGPTPLGASSPTTKPVELPKIAPKGPARQPANAIAAASTGNRYAVAGYGRIQLRTADRRSLVRTIEGLRGNVNDLVFSADGALLAAASGSPGVAGEVRIFKTKGAVPVRTIAGHADAVYTLAISPDGATLATGSYDQKIKLWDLKTGNELRTLEGHNGGVFDLAFRPDGKTLASAAADRTVKLWDVATGARLDTLSESTKELYAVAWTPDGSRVIAGGVDNRIRVWAVSATAKEGTNKLATSQFAHEGSILRLAFSADGKTILSSADDRTVKLWNAADVSPVRALPPQPDWPTALAFAPGDKAAIVGRLDGSVEFYDLASGSGLPPPPPAKPELTAAEPRGVQRGVATRVKLVGKNLDDVTAVVSHHPMLKAELAADGQSAAGAAVTLTADAALAPGAYEVSLKGPGGESAKIAIHVDDLPQTVDAEPKDEAPVNLPALPANVWGKFDRRGDTDAFTFDAKAGQPIVLDAAAKRLGAKADVVLTVTDASGRVLTHVNDTEGDLDPLVVFTPSADGRYGVRVSELQANGSGDHFYRLSVGNFGVVTGTSPLAVPPNAETALNLLGYNLPAGATARVKAGPGGEVDVPLDAVKFRPRVALKVPVSPLPATLEAEPNDRPAEATPLAVPGAGEGRIASSGGGEDADLFRFEAKAGQNLIVETLADGRGSPVDTRVEILHAADGKPVERVLLRAVRDSWITFRPIDANVRARLWHWEEMELNEYVYFQGEVAKLFLYPRGPDSEFDFYTINGKRRCYFDTTATGHALDEACYVVEPHPPGTTLPPNGLPTFTLHYANDDDADRRLGADSRVNFVAPKDGAYLARVTDARGLSGDRFAYRLTVRPAKHDFEVRVEGLDTNVPAGSGRAFTLKADRADGYDGPIRVDLKGLPPGFTVSSPVVIEAGHVEARATLFAAIDAKEIVAKAAQAKDAKSQPGEASGPAGVTVTATGQVNGKEVTKPVAWPAQPTIAAEPPVFVDLQPQKPTAPAKYTLDGPTPQITIAPGQEVPVWLRLERNGHDGLVSFDVENLPHGVIVSDIGLNGVLIPEKETQRQVFLKCAPWVQETDRLCYAKAREAGGPTGRPVMIHVRKPQQQAAGK